MEETELNLKPNLKILIIRLGAVGDVIRTIPIINYLHEKLVNPEISWIVEDRAANLLIDYPLLKNLYIIPRKKYYKIFEIIKKIRNEKFDIVFDFHGILKSGLISYFTGVKKRIGFHRKNCKEFNYIFNNIHCEKLPQKITRIEKNFNLLKTIFKNVEIPEKFNIKFSINQEKIDYIKNFLSKFNKFKKIVIINPFVSKKGRYKEWPLEYYINLGKFLKNLKDICFIVTWGPGEFEKAKKIVDSVNSSNIVLAPKTDMKELAVLIEKADIMLTGDTGPMHLASLLNIPIIAIFGPSDVDINRPWGDKNTVLWHNVGCNPCRKKKCKKLKCLYAVKPEEVYNTILEKL